MPVENSVAPVAVSGPSKAAASKVPLSRPASVRVANLFYLLALAVSVSTWFAAVGAPLWLDETASYWQISAGFSHLWERRMVGVPLYPFILAIQKALFGSGSVVLRIPSIVAMAAAVFVLYRAARLLFDSEVAIIAAVIFSLHPIVIFAAIDIRSYAFAILLVNSIILALLLWLRDARAGYAALLGALCAMIQYLQYIFAVLWLALAVVILVLKWRELRSLARHAVIALLAFVVFSLPAIPDLVYILRTSQTHIFAEAPTILDLAATLDPYRILYLLTLGGLLLAVIANRLGNSESDSLETRVVPVALGLIPILLLFGISRYTTLHIFVERYRLVAIPGIALCWALMISRIRSTWLRASFCLLLVAVTALGPRSVWTPFHGYSWKGALEVANAVTAQDHAPILMCSDYAESNFVAMPSDPAQSWLFSPLSYYRVSAAVVPLPRALNEVAREQVQAFLRSPVQSRARFLVVAYHPSTPTLRYIALQAQPGYRSRTLGIYDGISVVEYTLRTAD